MTSIDFYFNAGDRLQVACRLAGKSAAQGKRMLIYAPQPEMASRIDKLLWTWPAIGFLNLSADCPPHFERFERLFEVVAADDDERKAGRERYRFYQARGYRISNHDLNEDGERE